MLPKPELAFFAIADISGYPMQAVSFQHASHQRQEISGSS
jgi:hypothetical protein